MKRICLCANGLPAERKPSEYWQTNGPTSLSFVHKAEVSMRHEIGIETISFGRDYPHPEGTWPNTKQWLSDAFASVPDHELRLMLGENAIRVLDLHRAPLAEIASRIGPTIEDITGRADELDPRLVGHFDTRGGYLKAAEGDSKIKEIDEMLRADLKLAGIDA
jgi:Amidohydrolase